jgi:hypothetical protein
MGAMADDLLARATVYTLYDLINALGSRLLWRPAGI